MEPQIPANSSMLFVRKGAALEQAVLRVCSWTVQSQKRGVHSRMATETGLSIHNFADFREIRFYKKAVPVVAKTREDTLSMTRKVRFFSSYWNLGIGIGI